MPIDFYHKINQVLCLQEMREPINDADGRIIGYREKQSNGDIIIYTPQNRVIGKAGKSGTILYSGRRLSMKNEPGLLYAQLSY